MNKFLIADLAKITNGRISDNSGFFTGVSTDSRTTSQGNCFFALTGDNFNGHNFIDTAFSKGAVCAVVSEDIDNPDGKKILKVADTVKALGQLASQYRQKQQFKVVGITGSVGKTTTKHILSHVLSSRFSVFESPKNFNNHIGLPLTLLSANPDHQIIIAEMGSNHPGEIAYLTNIARPDYAVVTNVYPAHLEGFGSIETIMEEKLSIAQGLSLNGKLIINGNNKKLLQTCRYEGHLKTFGTSTGCNVMASDIVYKDSGSIFCIDGCKIQLPLPGPGNVENTLAAWAVCSEFGFTVEDFAQAIKNLRSVSMRSEVMQLGDLTILNDCYNANPGSMENALKILAGSDFDRHRRVFICGDMAELGSQTEHFHKQLGASIAKSNVNLLLAIGNFAKITVDSAVKHANNNIQTYCFSDVHCACNNLEKFIKDSDVVLVKGSRVNKLELAVEKLKSLFDKSKVAC